MGIGYRCEAATGLRVSVWDGDVDEETWRAHIERIAADPEWDTGRLFFTDLTTMSPVSERGTAEIVAMGQLFGEHLADRIAGAKWAVIAHGTFDDAVMFGKHIESAVPRLLVFNHLETGCAWLGVVADHVRAIVDELRRAQRPRVSRTSPTLPG
jgi:hypothetical protein